MRLAKETYRRGVFITGGPVPSQAPGPVIYGRPLEKPTADLAEIDKRLDAARRKLEEIAAAVRR